MAHTVIRSARTGRSVKESTVRRSPSATVTELVSRGTSNINRLAATDRFANVFTLQRRPSTTTKQGV